MKKKCLNKKLSTNKVTIADLSDKEQLVIRGGGTIQGRTCESPDGETILGHICE